MLTYNIFSPHCASLQNPSSISSLLPQTSLSHFHPFSLFLSPTRPTFLPLIPLFFSLVHTSLLFSGAWVWWLWPVGCDLGGCFVVVAGF